MAKPTDNSEIFLDQLIASIQTHLPTIKGIYLTTSLYPPLMTPGPGVVPFVGYSVPPASKSPAGAAIEAEADNQDVTSNKELYDKLDWSKIPLDKNDPDVQAIINPDVNKIEKRIKEDVFVSSDTEGGSARVSQLDNIKAEIIDKALVDQGLQPVTDTDTDLKSGYKNLDELLKIAGKLAPKLGKNLRINYRNLKSGYIKGVHGLCPQGTQSVVVALTGVNGLGLISGNADWFSFKDPSTGGGKSTFAKNIGGKVYYNEKVKIDTSYIRNSNLWQVGDIVVMGYLGGKPYGHIQVWTGWKWVSDFSQNKIQTNHVDFTTIALWRLNDTGKQALQSQKNKEA